MAPAPIPADPTLLSSPLDNSSKQPVLACASRRFASPVAVNVIEASFSQQNQSTPNIASEHSINIAEGQPSFSNSESRVDNVLLNGLQSIRNTSESSIFNIKTADLQKDLTSSSLNKKAESDVETPLVHEVRKSYNRLSLNNKIKRRKFLAGKRQHNCTSVDSKTVKRAKIEQTLPIKKNTKLIPEFSLCPEAPIGATSEINMINGHSSKLLDVRYASSNSTLNANSNVAHSNNAITVQQTTVNKINNVPPPIASLSNLGNTCFLNSVLYTLRFTPGFLHSLHHLVNDLGLGGNNINGNNSVVKSKRGIIGGNTNLSSNGAIGPSGYYSTATINGCSSAGNSENESETNRTLDVVDQLHDLFRNMSIIDETPENSREPIQPNNFLQAVGKLNPMFEGNQQQDAHELLVTVLNTLQDIKIPVPAISNIATNDVIDHGSTIKSHCEVENHNGGKKGKQKKTGKSIFYPGSGSNVNCNPPNSSSSGSHVSNGFRPSTKSDQVELSSQYTKAPSANFPGNVSSETLLLPNFVKENFVGKSGMRTRCLECEASTYRSETFTNIDIPLNFDANDCHVPGSDQDVIDGQHDVKDLFLKQIMASETLRENNKYWCSECSRLNEAQRTVEYELLPQVLVLQLKRFTATGTKSSYMSKICDHIPTPFTMNCFCTQCLPSGSSAMNSLHSQHNTSKHHYRLYAVIMHLGATLASGHYTAYVRATDQALEYLQCQRGNSGSRSHCNSAERIKNGKSGERNASSGGSGKGIMKYFSRNSSSSDTRHNTLNNINSSGGSTQNGYHSSNGYMEGCKSSNCCGIRTASQIAFGSEGAPTKISSSISAPDSHETEKIGALGPHHQRSLDCMDSTDHTLYNGHNHELPTTTHTTDNGVSALTPNSTTSEELWLECDDETIHVISRKQFEDELKPNRGYTTPYLLFYQKVT